MIRRYAELSAAFVSVNEHCSDDTFHRLLSDMHMEIDHFILRLSSVFQQRKEQLIFSINNYDLILSVMGVRSILSILKSISEFFTTSKNLFIPFSGTVRHFETQSTEQNSERVEHNSSSFKMSDSS